MNDAFVMRQWGLHQKLIEEKEDASAPVNPGNFKKCKLLPDGACHFTRGMGEHVDQADSICVRWCACCNGGQCRKGSSMIISLVSSFTLIDRKTNFRFSTQFHFSGVVFIVQNRYELHMGKRARLWRAFLAVLSRYPGLHHREAVRRGVLCLAGEQHNQICIMFTCIPYLTTYKVRMCTFRYVYA